MISVTFVQINSKYIHSPLAAWYIKTNSKLNVQILDTNINVPYEKILREIISLGNKCIAFSCYIFNIELIKNLVVDLKKIDDYDIILGGPEVNSNYDYFLPYVKNIIIGEGEFVFDRVVLNLATSTQQIIYAPTITNLDDITSPYNDDFFLSNADKIIYYESSRGCPFSCSYCLSSITKGVRYFSIERVKKDLDILLSKNLKQVKFVDRTFNASKTHAKQIFKYLIKKNTDTNFHFEVAADIFDDEMLQLISSAKNGLFQFEIGVQSFDEDTLSNINRKTNIAKVEDNILSLMSFKNCHIHTDLIAGLPNETLQGFRKGFNRLYGLSPHIIQIGFLKVLNGCSIAKSNYGLVYQAHSPYEVLKTNFLSTLDILQLKSLEYAVDKLYNSRYFLLTKNYLINFFADAYDMYLSLGSYIEKQNSLSLENLYMFVFQFMSVKNIDSELLFNLMKYDYLSSNKVSYLPKFFKKTEFLFKACNGKVIAEFSYDVFSYKKQSTLYNFY